MNRSPAIVDHSWGLIEVDGVGRGKDFKLWPGGGREWDWNETGTRHVPGIQLADVKELIEQGSRIIVLSRGRLLRLETCPETIEFLGECEIPIQVHETAKAIDVYNELAVNGEAVGGLFHSTC